MAPKHGRLALGAPMGAPSLAGEGPDLWRSKFAQSDLTKLG